MAKKKINIKPLHDRVLIREMVDKKEKTEGGIYLPETAKEDNGSKRGEVIAVGNGKYDDGQLVPMTVKEGDMVLFGWGDMVSIDGEEYYIVKESEISAIVE